ncbi:MAG TPA: GNAT family N-acetyltransferase [Ktedonobacterales bacterium]|nr:GNAT family N-acetyltransferase [Ktedonobacterales bacterium]
MSEANIIIRQGTVKEYSQAREVISETLAFHQQAAPEFFRTTDSPPPTAVVIEDFLRDGQGAWFLAEAGGRVVGFATVRLRPAADEPFLVPAVRAHVDSLGILPAWRRRGIGRRLMAAAEQWARQHDARRITLNVWEFNDGALQLYEALGYKTFSRNLWKPL